MKIRDTIGKIFLVLFLVVPFLILIGIVIFVKSPTLSAKESYQKASEILKNQERKAVLTKIYAGSIPITIHGSVSSRETGGRGDRWHICFYSKEEDKSFYFTNSSKDEIKEGELTGRCKTEHPTGITIKKWKVDSEEAVAIAKDKAKELKKEDFIIVKIELRQEKESPLWKIEFLPPKVGKETVGLRMTINAETGKVIKITEPTRSYITV